MPIIIEDAGGAPQSVNTLGDYTIANPFPVTTTNSTNIDIRLGPTTEAPAASDTAASGINGLIRRVLIRITEFFSILGAISDVANAEGSLMARLKAIATSQSTTSKITITSASVTTSLETVLEVVTEQYRYLSLWIQNTGGQALNELKTEAGYSEDLLYKYSFLAGSADANSYGNNMGKRSGNSLVPVVDSNGLPAIASGSEGYLELDVRRFQRIRLQASVETGSTTLQINGILKY